MERPRHITIWKPEIKGTPILEWSIQPKNAAKGVLLALGISAAVMGSKYLVDYLDDTMRPTYVTNGQYNSMLEEKPEWVRPTIWVTKPNGKK
jgi:hypothetical protein